MALTKMQIAFAKHYIYLHDAKNSALNAGYSKSYADTKAYMLLKSDAILEEIAKLEKEYFTQEFSKLAFESMKVLAEMISPEEDTLMLTDDKTRLAAIKEVFKYHRLEQKLNASEKSEDTQFNIVFNEVASRDS